MTFRKITAFLMSILFIFGTTAFAITDTDIANFAKKQADANMKAVTEVKTKDGGDLTALIKHDKIIPIYYFANNGFDQFKDYKTGEFYKEFQTEPVGYYVAATDGQYIEIARYTDPERSIGGIIDSYMYLFDGIIFNDTNLSKLLSDAGVNEITDMRVSYFMDYDSNVLFYINTDKGEFIVLSRNTHRMYFDDILEAGVLYTADEVVDWRKRVLVEAEAEYEYEQAHISNEPYWTVDENGDDVYVTPEPKTDAQPARTAAPAPMPKATVIPADTPAESAKPSETAKPEASATPLPTDKPAATPEPKTLEVNGNDMSIRIDDNAVDFPDAKPFIDDNDRTQIPIRAVAELLDCAVEWNDEAKTAVITSKNGDIVKITIDSSVLTRNDEAVQMDTAAMIKDSRTYIPIRFIAEALGLTVVWNK